MAGEDGSGNSGTEGDRREFTEFEALAAEGDPDEGNAPKDTEDEPSNGTDKTGEEKPKNIAERFHEKVILSNQKM